MYEVRLLEVLDRRVPIDSLGSMRSALSTSAGFDLVCSAIVFDTNILLKLPSSKRRDDILDYIGNVHQGPVVIPGQVIQEFWNNHLQSVIGSAERVKNEFVKFSKGVKEEVDAQSLKGFEELCDAFVKDNAHSFDDRWLSKVQSMLDVLSQRAIVSYVTRLKFFPIAEVRKQTKTPPGFKDDLYGDFYVWADGLLGVMKGTAAVGAISQLVFVTEDKRQDWSTKDKPHPILNAEVNALFGVGLQLLTIQQLTEAIENM